VPADATEEEIAAARYRASDIAMPEPTTPTGGYVEEKRWRCLETVSWSDGYAMRQTSTGGEFEREVFDERLGVWETVKDVAPPGGQIQAVVRQCFVGDVVTDPSIPGLVSPTPSS